MANSTVVFSGRGGAWIFKNATTGSFTLTCKVTGQTGVVVTQGETVIIYCTGTDIAKAGGVDGALNFLSAEVTVSSASTTDALGAASVFVAITGTTTIANFGTGANRLRILRFAGALTLTHSSALLCPGAVNCPIAAGDQIVIKSDGSSNARIVSILRAAGLITQDYADSSVTYAKMQNVSATAKVLGRKTAAAGVVEEIDFTSVARTLAAQTTQALMRTTGLGLGELAVLDFADLVYTGSSASNVTFPVATPLMVAIPSGGALNRNASSTVRLSGSDSIQYTISGAGSALGGTWRASGLGASGADSTQLFSRRA